MASVAIRERATNSVSFRRINVLGSNPELESNCNEGHQPINLAALGDRGDSGGDGKGGNGGGETN